MKKRILSVLLTVVMLIVMLPTAVFAEGTTPYDLWVGGVQVTDANKGDLVTAINQAANDTIATGLATYDPDSKTLTLNNFSYTGEGRVTQNYNAAISTDSINLNVELHGTNTITCQSDDESVKCHAIRVWYGLDHSAGHLTIYGTDKETDKLICTANDGISSVRSLTVEDAAVQTNGALISSYSGVTITDSIVSADLEAGDITLENSVLEISKTAYTGDNFTITNSIVTGGVLSAFDYASTLTVKGSQVNVTVISACGFIIEGNSNVTAQAILVDLALIVTDSSVHVTGGGLPELGLEGSFGILLLRSYGVVAIDNSTVEVYGDNGAYLYTDDFQTFTPFAPSFVDGEEPADPYDYTVYAGESAPGQCADASDVNTYANKYVRIEPKQPQQPVAPKSTVEFMVDGKVWRTYSVTKGADIKMPEVPVKEGYVGKWDHSGKNIRTATTITAVYTEDINTNDLSEYSNFDLEVYGNSRVTNIISNNGTIIVDGYMFMKNGSCNKEDSIWREIIFVNEDDYSLEKAYRKQVTPVYNTWLNKNMNATGNGKYKLDYANYTVAFSTTNINSYVDNKPTTMAKGSYLAYMRISDGTNSYLFPLKDIVLSDGSTLELPTGFEVVDSTRALRYIVK